MTLLLCMDTATDRLSTVCHRDNNYKQIYIGRSTTWSLPLPDSIISQLHIHTASQLVRLASISSLRLIPHHPFAHFFLSLGFFPLRKFNSI